LGRNFNIHRELGKHGLAAHWPALMQVKGDGD
jgi:hypothetical protein